VRGDLVGRLNYSVALYHANVRDELIGYAYPPPTAPGRVYFQNAGKSRHRGIELGTELEIVSGLDLTTTWTYSDFRYTSYTIGTRSSTVAAPRHPAALAPFPAEGAAGVRARAWVEVEETHSSGYVVNDTLDTATSPWWATDVRLGWDGTVGSLRLRPFVGLNNLWNRFYVASVVINAANGAIMSRLRAGTCMSGSRWVQGNSRRTSTEWYDALGSMVRDRGGRGARRGTAVRAGVGRGRGPVRCTERGRDERHAAQRRGERRLADVRAQLLEQPLLPPEDD